MKFLTRQEELVLLTIYQLKGCSYLVKIREHLIENTGKEWSISSVYVPLDRLHKAGILSTTVGKPTGKRGGKAIKYYEITKFGLKSLAELKAINDTMWKGVTNIITEG